MDHQFTGKVERIDVAMIKSLLENDIIPVIPPLGYDGVGQTYRLNSDAIAVEVAKALESVKLIYLASHRPPFVGKRMLRQVTSDDAANYLKKHRAEINPTEAISKLEQAIRAGKGGVPRFTLSTVRFKRGSWPKYSRTMASAP